MKNRWVVVCSIIFIVCGFLMLSLEPLQRIEINNVEEKKLDKYLNSYSDHRKKREESDYIGVISIPKIDLKKGLVSPSSKYNKIDYNIEILKESIILGGEVKHLFLAAHSGNSNISFFRNLNKIQLEDEVVLDYEGRTYKYLVNEIKEVNKTGSVELELDYQDGLILMTCKRGEKKQIVVICKLE